MKIRPVRAELLHAHGQTDRHTHMTKLKVVFRNFEKMPRDQSLNSVQGNDRRSDIQIKHLNQNVEYLKR